MYARLSEQFLPKHPRQFLEAGDKVWIKVNRKGMDSDYTKSKTSWKRPAESLQPVGVGRYKEATEITEKMLDAVGLEAFSRSFGPVAPPLYYWYTPAQVIVEQDKYVVESGLRFEV